MRIALKRLTFEGVGPFRQEENFELPETGVTYVYAPNGHGKTSTIDLVRWLIRGPLAIEKNEFRSLKQDHEKNVINHHRFRNMKGGRAEAILEIEDRGRYKITREIEWSTDPASTLTVSEDQDGTWVDLDEPAVFIANILPHERLGFNLLTGEHIKDFVEELSGPVVKRSVERLLQNPELVSLHDCLSEIVDELEKEARAEDRVKNRRLKLLDERSQLKERLASYEQAAREKEKEEHQLHKRIEELNQDLAKAEQLQELETEQAELVSSIADLRERKKRETAALAKAISPSWRTVLEVAGNEPARQFMAGYDQAIDAREAWQEEMAEVRVLERLHDAGTCVCGTEMTKQHRSEIQTRIHQVQSDKPHVPALPADEWTLRSWANGAGTAEVVETITTHHQRLSEITEDLAEKQDRLTVVNETLEDVGADGTEKIERRIKALKMKINAIQDKKNRDVRNQLDVQDKLNAVKEKLANTQADPVDGPLLSKARTYNAAIRATIDGALPKLRQDLLDRIQAIFDKLFHKDSQFRIKLSESSMIPHVVRDVDGEEEPVLLSEGEKTRLGLSLLFALRDVATERPFLLLDAPFSTLDDEGVHRLLELIRDHQGQVVVFTKDAFPSGRWYDAVRDADPAVYRMDWVKHDVDDMEGYTTVEPDEVEALCLQGGA